MKLKISMPFKNQRLKIATAVLLVGVGAGFFSHLFHLSLVKVSSFLKTDQAFTVQTFLIAFGLVLLSYLLGRFLFKDTQGSGIPQVKLSLTVFKGKMPRRMPLGKFITSFLSLASGLSMGKEGPMVTVSAAWGHLVSHIMDLDRRMTKTLVSSGAAAGLAAAFNTPIAAVVFTVEEIMGELNTKYLAPIIVTSVIASVTAFELRGNSSTFIPLHYEFDHEWHLFFYSLVGLIMSFVGSLWIKTILFLKDFRSKYLENNEIVFIFIALLLTALASQISAEILGDGIESINHLLEGYKEVGLIAVAILFVLKFVLSATAYSTGLSGGLFMPVLFLGASGGALIGFILQNIGFVEVEIGIFALIGMTSLLVAVIRTPFTAFIMLFEMTRSYELILPLMVSSVVAYYITSIISKESVYEAVSEYEGVHLPNASDHELLDEQCVDECMIQDVLSFQEDDKIKDIMPKVEQFNYGAFPILAGKELTGIVHRDEIIKKFDEDPELLVKTIARQNIIKIYPDQSFMIAFDKMKKYSIGRLIVVSRFNDRRLIGMVTPQNIVEFISTKKE